MAPDSPDTASGLAVVTTELEEQVDAPSSTLNRIANSVRNGLSNFFGRENEKEQVASEEQEELHFNEKSFFDSDSIVSQNSSVAEKTSLDGMHPSTVQYIDDDNAESSDGSKAEEQAELQESNNESKAEEQAELQAAASPDDECVDSLSSSGNSFDFQSECRDVKDMNKELDGISAQLRGDVIEAQDLGIDVAPLPGLNVDTSALLQHEDGPPLSSKLNHLATSVKNGISSGLISFVRGAEKAFFNGDEDEEKGTNEGSIASRMKAGRRRGRK